MILGHIERLKVIVIGLDLGTVHHIKAHRLENVDHVVQNDIERMQSAGLVNLTGHGDIQLFRLQLFLLKHLLQSGGALAERRIQLLSQLVDELSHLRALLCGQRTHAAQDLGERSFFAHKPHTEVLEILRGL